MTDTRTSPFATTRDAAVAALAVVLEQVGEARHNARTSPGYSGMLLGLAKLNLYLPCFRDREATSHNTRKVARRARSAMRDAARCLGGGEPDVAEAIMVASVWKLGELARHLGVGGSGPDVRPLDGNGREAS